MMRKHKLAVYIMPGLDRDVFIAAGAYDSYFRIEIGDAFEVLL